MFLFFPIFSLFSIPPTAICGSHHAHPRATHDSLDLLDRQNGLHGREKVTSIFSSTHALRSLNRPRLTSFFYFFPTLCISACETPYSEDQAYLAARKYARIVQRLGFEVRQHCMLTKLVFALLCIVKKKID